jgi:hypothetical protein
MRRLRRIDSGPVRISASRSMRLCLVVSPAAPTAPVIGRTTMGSDRSELPLDRAFADHVPRLRAVTTRIEDRELGAGIAAPPAELWTATQAIAVTRRVAR